MLYCYLWPVHLFHIFIIISQMAQCWKKVIEHKMCVLIFSTIHTIKSTNALMLNSYFLYTICHKPDMFQSILITFREWVNTNKAYIKHRLFTTSKFVHKMFVGIIKLICSSVELVHKMLR
jgi:hypothetical protein